MKKDHINKLKEILEEVEKIQEEIEEESELKCSLVKDLQNEYKNYTKWVFGRDSDFFLEKEECKKIWNKLHGHLPTPRIFYSTEDLPTTALVISLMIDAYPLYLQEKNGVGKH